MQLPADPFANQSHTLANVFLQSGLIFWQERLAFLKLGAMVAFFDLWLSIARALEHQSSIANSIGPLLVPLLGAIVEAATIRTAVEAFLQIKSIDLWYNLQQGLNRLTTILKWFFKWLCGWVTGTILVIVVIGLVVWVIGISILKEDEIKLILPILPAVWVLLAVLLSYIIFVDVLFCVPTIVVEQVNAKQALEHGRNLVHGRKCHVWVAVLLLMVLSIAVSVLERFIVPIKALHLLSCLVLTPFSTVVVTVLYVHARIDKEGCNRARLEKELKEVSSSNTVDYQPLQAAEMV